MIRKIDPQEFKRLASSMSRSELAKHYGVARGTVSGWCKRLGVPPAPRGPTPRVVDLERLRQLVEEGYTITALTQALQVHRSTVQRWCSRLGLKPQHEDQACDESCRFFQRCKSERLWLTGVLCELDDEAAGITI